MSTGIRITTTMMTTIMMSIQITSISASMTTIMPTESEDSTDGIIDVDLTISIHTMLTMVL